MSNAVLVVVDIQKDFCAGGRLAIPDAEAVIPVVNSLMRTFQKVVLTQDWHPPGHVSFASSHPGRHAFERISLPSGDQVLWPDHCVAGSLGAAFHQALVIPANAVVIRKGIHPDLDAYSAFYEVDRTTPVGLEAVLRACDAGEILLAGLATDYCVLQTALDGRSLGYEVTVIDAGCRGIDQGGTVAVAWEAMANAGVRRG